MRCVHATAEHESVPDPDSSRYHVYLLDVSQLAAHRAWKADFLGWINHEKRRARKLVFKPVATPTELEDSEIGEAEDEDAIVGNTDKSGVQEPLNL